MTYLLDTNTCIDFLNRRNSRIEARLTAVAVSEVSLCSVVKAELYLGAYRSSQRAKNLALLADFFPQFVSYSFDDVASEVYGRMRAELMSRGQIIGPNDLLIAAIAIANGLTLVTHNTREFGRVPGLQLEDWEAA